MLADFIQCKLTYLGLTHLWFLHCRASSLLLSRASSACLLGLPAAHAVFVYCGRKLYLMSYVTRDSRHRTP